MKRKGKLLIGILTITVIFIFVDVFVYYIASSVQKNKMFNHLERDLNISLAAINPDRVESVANSLSDTSVDFLRLKEQLIKLREQFVADGVDSVYSMKKDGGEILFLVDSLESNDPDYGPPGEKYLNPPSNLFPVFLNGQATFVGPYSDEYGEFYSFFKPIVNFADNEIIGVLGIDIKTDIYNNDLSKMLIYCFGISVFLYILSILLLIYIQKFFHSREALSAEKKMTEGLLNILPDIFYLFDKNGKMLLWNKSFCDKIGISNEEISKIKVFDLFLGKNKKKFETSVDRSYQSGYDVIEVEVVTKSGSLWLELYNTLFKNDEGDIIGIAGSGHDISLRHEREHRLSSQRDELENMNRLMIGRETKMVELKKEISILKDSLKNINN
jgi:PAS domain S-box-containing protein